MSNNKECKHEWIDARRKSYEPASFDYNARCIRCGEKTWLHPHYIACSVPTGNGGTFK